MTSGAYSRTLRFGTPGGPAKEGPSARDVADVILAAALRARVVSLTVEPGAEGHDVMVETPDGRSLAFMLGGELGNLVVARVALTAGLDVSLSVDRTGRIAVSADGKSGDVMVMPTLGPSGLGVDVRRVVRSADETRAEAAAARPAASPARSPQPSADHIGHYRLIEKLGEGGAGIVYRAEHEALGKPVAIKILHAEIAQDPTMASVLLREGRAASRAQHPGIVNVTDYGNTSDGRTYLVMELVEWPTLFKAMNHGWVTPMLAIKIAREILVSLDVAHSQGVVHRDLKPENIFVGPDSQVKICDFGTAMLFRTATKKTQDVPSEGNIWGTPLYMAPEQAVSGAIDRRTDLYAVGCILFEMLTGKPPYDAEQPIQILLQHVNEPIPAVSSPEGPLPDVVLRTVARAMAKKPGARYQAASEMIADLDRCALTLLRKEGWQQWLPV